MKMKVGLILGCVLGVTAVANAAEEPANKTPPVANESAMRVYVDPVTGELVSQPVTAEQRQAASAADETFSQDGTGLREVQMPDGSYMVDLQGRFQQATVVEAGAKGVLKTRCGDADHVELGTHDHADDGVTVDAGER